MRSIIFYFITLNLKFNLTFSCIAMNYFILKWHRLIIFQVFFYTRNFWVTFLLLLSVIFQKFIFFFVHFDLSHYYLPLDGFEIYLLLLTGVLIVPWAQFNHFCNIFVFLNLVQIFEHIVFYLIYFIILIWNLSVWVASINLLEIYIINS